MSVGEKKDPSSTAHLVRSSGATGSISTMTDAELLTNHPSAMDPAVIGVVRGREKGLTPENVVRMPSAMDTMARVANIFAEGDKVYHKVQKKEAIYAGEVKGQPKMAFVKVGGNRFRVEKDKLVKL